MSPDDNVRPTLTFNALTVPLDPGITLVEASAGTGKTFAITRLVLRLLLEHKVPSLANVLVVTFTEKATQELVTRIRSALRLAEEVWSNQPPAENGANRDLFVLKAIHGGGGREIVQRALASLDDLAVSTIHGFCKRVLSESALESKIPFRTTFIQDETEPLGRAARDWARVRLRENPDEARLVVNSDTSPEQWLTDSVRIFRRQPGTRLEFDNASPEQSLLADYITTVDRAFENEKQRRHLLGFDDLLRKLADVLKSEGSRGPLAERIRTRFGAALIDEFQDTDETQYAIFRNAFDGCPLFLIGDPKQSIYRFRGADIHAYLQASESAERKYTLLENYRSTASYVRAVETLFTRATDPFLVPESDIGFPKVTAALAPDPVGGLANDGGAALEWWWVDGTLGVGGKFIAKGQAYALLFRDIANEIGRLRADGLAFNSVAILVRSNSEALQAKGVLDGARIPAVVAGDADVLNAEECNELLRLVAAIASPTDGRAVRAAMATVLWGSTANEIAVTLREDGEAQMLAVSEAFTTSRDTWRTRGAAAAIGAVLAERRAAERMVALPDGERRTTNLRHLVELVHEAWATEGLSPDGMAAWVARERTVPNTPDRRELRLETDSEAVQILTMHKAKGLQFDVVFCPSLWSYREPSDGPLGVKTALADVDGDPVFDLGSEAIAERLQAQMDENKAESLRLTYVALTRAVHRCYVAWGAIGKDLAVNSALGYLLRTNDGTAPRAVLDQLVVAASGTMRVRNVEKDAVSQSVSLPTAAHTVLRARDASLAPRQLDTWSVTSFTGLTADTHAEESRDVADPVMAPSTLRPGITRVGIHAFPVGAQAGVALHNMLERLDFRRASEPRVREMVVRSLALHGLTGADAIAAERADDVTRMLETVSNATIPGAAFALRDLAPQHTLREWRFDLSVRTTSARRIADVLTAHGSAHAKTYAPMLRDLRDSAVNGYLNGVVDLAFEHDHRWWVVDWKSNRLGDDAAEYSADAMDAAMMNAHYTLQYHLYVLALHRHLQVRQPGYDATKHMGGVAYLFLRGVTGEGSNGWFRDTPSSALLNALDAALGRRI